MTDQALWAVHCEGPDEILAAPSHEDAVALVADMDAIDQRHGCTGPYIRGRVIKWPGDAASHAADLEGD